MAESPGTWVKLGHKEWKYIPPSVREQACKHGLAWNAAVEMTKCFRTGEPDDDVVMTLGKYMSNHAHLKSRTEVESSTEFVELTPRSAVTEKVTSAIKLKDGRSVPVRDKSARPPPPPVPAGNEAAMPLPPPGNFEDKAEMSSPPGNFEEPNPPPGNFIEAPPGNFDAREQPPLPLGPPPRAHINHGVVQFPSNHAEEEEEGSQTT